MADRAVSLSLGDFARAVERVFSPWRRASGTEHMALLLYSIIRSTRPRSVVEYGPGYTTFFIAKALKDNMADAREELDLLLAKSAFITDGFTLPAEPVAIHHMVEQWMSSGDKSANVNPAFYASNHVAHLYAMEELAEGTPYSMSLKALADYLDVADVMTFMAGATDFGERLPREAFPLDLAWNDNRDYRRFFTALWPVLNPSGGMIVFHYTSSREYSADIDWMRSQRESHGDLEVLTVVEPHKLVQNGCTILRKTAAAKPDAPVNPDAVIESLKRLIAGHRRRSGPAAVASAADLTSAT
jgi:hypothetical protein